MKNFYDFTLKELQEYLTGHGKERFRAEQLFRWIYQKQVTELDLMTNLSKQFRDDIKGLLFFELPKVTQQLDSLDGTRKFLMKVEGEKEIEAVLIPNEDRLTLCVSSEVGCAMGCKFCFTAKMGLMRRLNAYEIVGQFINAANSLKDGRRITNIVFMGMGEPLDNVDNVMRAIEILHHQMGIGFGLKKITISTSGLAPLIKRVAEAKVRLAVSLNATTNEIRDRVMPINRKYPLETLLAACKEYVEECGDMVTFEYVMLKGVNDSVDDAHRIAKLTRGIPSKINLIPFNEHPGSGFIRPASSEVHEFQKTLMNLGRHVLVRKTMGRDIFAACGQLRSEMEEHPERMAIK
jgi:23S rRNA (adenine2503-C2)-methyltransferase